MRGARQEEWEGRSGQSPAGSAVALTQVRLLPVHTAGVLGKYTVSSPAVAGWPRRALTGLERLSDA